MRSFFMEEYVVYVLMSDSTEKLYTGFTSTLISRMISHNKLGKGWTARYRPWRVIHLELFSTKRQAMAREKWLKSGVGRDWIKEHALK